MACCSRCPSTNLTHVKIEAPTNALSYCRQSDLTNDINQQRLSCPTFGKRDFRENYCAAPCSKKLISLNWASKHVGIGLLRRGKWMEVVPFNFCHQPAFCRMLSWFFRRKLLQAIFRCSNRYIVPKSFWNGVQTVTPWHSKGWQEAAKGSKAKAAAGAQTPLAGKHFADFLLTFAAVFFFPWDLIFAA